MIGNKPLIIILGATAVGKTSLAIALAQQLNGEIIGADSRQIYRYMDIGTAKPTPEEQAQIPHHLIDFVDPDYSLAVAEYQDLAYRKIDELHEQNKLPFLVGGTGQYITAVEEGWSFPRVAPNIELRQELENFAETQGVERLYQRLLDVDADAAQSIHPNNVRRVVRALEVYLETGTPFSILQQKKPPPYQTISIGLKMERESLYQRADLRVDHMMKMELVAEVECLLKRGYHEKLPSMSAVGYAQIIPYLNGDYTLEEAITRIKFDTHSFIRRQEMWFRGHDNGILWYDAENIIMEELISTIQSSLSSLDAI